jgi:signal transduction histidine kinase
MVDDILVIARSGVGDLVHERIRFDLAAEVVAAVDPFNRTGAGIEVECEPVRVCGDRLRTRHVLRNLIDNALRHGAPPVRIIGTSDRGYTLAVEDAGSGPPDDDIFRPFIHSADHALVAGSLGLGLGVSRVLCEGMGVDLGVERVAGVTRFTLRFDENSIAHPNVATRQITDLPGSRISPIA